jgi:hypothetical protein
LEEFVTLAATPKAFNREGREDYAKDAKKILNRRGRREHARRKLLTAKVAKNGH